jgi:hypothetical protein
MQNNFSALRKHKGYATFEGDVQDKNQYSGPSSPFRKNSTGISARKNALEKPTGL